MKPNSSPMLAAALAALAVLAGCGSSGPSKADFVKKADALCAQTNKAHPPPTEAKSLKERGAQAGEEVQIRKELDAKLRKLDVPDDLKKDFDSYNAATQKIITDISRAQGDAARGDEAKYTADLQQVEKTAIAREATAKKLGFKVCGRQNPAQ
jgi:predicted small lipoprotein YifL